MIDTDELRRVMRALGKRGGQARSPAKTEAARRNGARRYCRHCHAQITSADRQAGQCTQCGEAIRGSRKRSDTPTGSPARAKG